MRRAGRSIVLFAALGCASRPPEPPPAPGAAAPGPEAPGPAPGTPPAPAPLDPRSDPSFHTIVSRAGRFTIAWRPLAGAVPKNEYFALEAYLYQGEQAVPGAELVVSAWMPDHGHGLVVQPRTTERGEGRYEVDGMLLHMRGKWELFFDVVKDGFSERAQFDLELR